MAVFRSYLRMRRVEGSSPRFPLFPGGETFTAKMMEECVWVKPKLVVQIAFLEWTNADRLRHSRFVGIRDDKDPREVIKES
jgi:ATP-dependent DNA ligase